MNRTRRFRPVRRLSGLLAGLAATLLAAATAAPAAFADPVPPIGGGGDVVVAPSAPPQIVVAGGMPGWQIALIALGVAVLAAAVAVFLDRARTARRHQAAPGT
jgi:hypothetical protein